MPPPLKGRQSIALEDRTIVKGEGDDHYDLSINPNNANIKINNTLSLIKPSWKN
jgi:hypothetical protein